MRFIHNKWLGYEVLTFMLVVLLVSVPSLLGGTMIYAALWIASVLFLGWLALHIVRGICARLWPGPTYTIYHHYEPPEDDGWHDHPFR